MIIHTLVQIEWPYFGPQSGTHITRQNQGCQDPSLNGSSRHLQEHAHCTMRQHANLHLGLLHCVGTRNPFKHHINER
jgi:hypothetical protein